MKLELNNVVVERGGRTLFAPLSLSVESGTLLYVRGANGAGKTSLLRVLAGLSAASAGRVVWLDSGTILNAGTANTFIGHANAMNDALSVAQNLSYAASLAGLDASTTHIDTALSQLGIAKLANCRVATLSQGQRKRATLARLLLRSQPGSRAWLLDEPFVALDIDTQKILEQLIATELKAGAIVVLTSHQPFAIGATNTMELTL
jgi:heme exporter protein A